MTTLRTRTLPACALVAGLLTACAQVEPETDFDTAREAVASSTGRAADAVASAEGLDAAAWDDLLADGLTLDEALDATLRNDRRLAARWQRIGVAHADWVQARLMENPFFDLALRVPTEGGTAILEGGLGFQLLELWRLPDRSEAARAELDAVILDVAREAGESLAETRRAYWQAVRADAERAQAEALLAIAEDRLSAERTRAEAGVADDLAVARAEAPVAAAQLDLQAARLAAESACSQLARRLSYAGSLAGVVLADSFDAGQAASLDAEALVARALDARLDLQAADRTVAALQARVALADGKTWDELSAGLAFESAGSDDTSIGPAIGGGLPLFDRNQAGRARARYLLAEAEALRDAARVEVAQDVRAAVAAWNARVTALAQCRSELLPRVESALALTRKAVEAGHRPRTAALDAQADLLHARRTELALLHALAEARTDVELALGAPVTARSSSESSSE